MASFLEKAQLAYFWGKIKEYVTNLLKGKADKVRGIEFVYGTQTRVTGAWTGVTADDELYDGKQILYYLPFAGSGNATLNLTLADGTKTGAKNVYFQATDRMTTHYGAYQQFILVYHRALNINGTNYEGWWSEPGRDTDTTYRINVNTGYKAKTALYRYEILLTYDNKYLLPTNAVNGGTETTKAITTIDFDIFGPIYYYYYTTNVAAEGSIGPAKYTAFAHVDLRYAFNLTTSSLTVGKAVYLVVEPLPEDGSRGKLHSTPIVQDLPESEDGLVYILLGAAYNGYCIYLLSEHARYWYKDGQLRAYTNTKDFSEDVAALRQAMPVIKYGTATPTTADIAPGEIYLKLGT